MSTTIHVKADIYNIEWDTLNQYTSLPTSVHIDIKTKDVDGFMHQAIMHDLEKRYLVKVASYSKRNFQFSVMGKDKRR